ncbi:MAG: hypothetical protein V5A37_04655, partial [Halobacteriales archaeon]
MSGPEADFHSRLFVRLSDYLDDDPGIPFADVSVEEQTERGRADLVLETHRGASAAIEVVRPDVDPRSAAVVKRAQDYAHAVDAGFFATCNANDFFLYDHRGDPEISDIEFYYLDLRDGRLRDATSEILEAVVHLFEEDRLPSQQERERIVGVLRSFHSAVWPTFHHLAEQAHDSNERFRDEFDTWARENDYQGLPEDQ